MQSIRIQFKFHFHTQIIILFNNIDYPDVIHLIISSKIKKYIYYLGQKALLSLNN